MQRAGGGWGLVAALALLAGPGTAHSECPSPAVRVEGARALVRALGGKLGSHGVHTTAAPGCRTVQVRVQRRRGDLVVAIRDAARREVVRSVRDLDTAAAIIAAWTQTPASSTALELVEPAPPAPPAPAARRASSRRPRTGVMADFTLLFPLLGHGLGGWSAGLCIQLHPVCLGGRVRRTRGEELTEYTDARTFDLLVEAAMPVEHGPWSFGVAAQAGHGWFSAHSFAGTQERDRGFRTGLSMWGGRQLALGLWLALGVGGDTLLSGLDASRDTAMRALFTVAYRNSW
jgi:hypothetical protein